MNDARRRPPPTASAAVVSALLLLLSLSLPWGMVHLNFDGSLLAGMEGVFKDDTYSAWRMHKTWDDVIAVAAALAILANLRLLLGRRDHAGVSALVSSAAGVVSGFAVVLTMIDPPIPPQVDFINSMHGGLLPKIELHPRFGLFVSLALAAALLLAGLAQLVAARRAPASGSPEES